MRLALQALLAALLALCFAVPGVTDEGEGGENAGGTGVWILPRSSHVACLESTSPSAGQSFAIQHLNRNVEFVVSAECNQVAALMVVSSTGSGIALPVQGRTVLLDKAVLTGLAAGDVTSAEILIADSEMQGYRIGFTLNAAKTGATLQLR